MKEKALIKNNPSESDMTGLGEQIRDLIRLLKVLPSEVIIVKVDGEVVFANQPAVDLLKRLKVKVVGNKLPDYQSDISTLRWVISNSTNLDYAEFSISPITLDGQKLNCLITKSDENKSTSHLVSEEVFKSLFEQSNDGIAICDQNLRFMEWNRGMERITGYSAKDVTGLTLGELAKKISPSPNSPIEERHILMGNIGSLMRRLIKGGKYLQNEMEIRDRFGVKHIAHYRMFPVFWHGKLYPAAVIRDITDIKQAEETLRDSEIRFRTLVEAMGEGAITLDLELKILFSNPAADSMYGAGTGYLLGKNIREFIDPGYEPFLKTQIQRTRQGLSNRYEMNLSDFRGNTHTIFVTSSPWRGVNQEINGSIIVFSDITERKIAEEKLRFVSTHDEITKLYNRNYYEEEKNRLKAGRRYPVSAVIIDMDEFKTVNDTLGHGVGDTLLKNFGSLTRRIFRGEDVVARIGGDEFAVLLPETDRLTVLAVVARLQESVAQYNEEYPDQKIFFSVGTGTANTPLELEDAIRRADNRMYREKKQKKKNDELTQSE